MTRRGPGRVAQPGAIEVWRDPNLVAWSGAFCIGPTATGKVVGWLKNDARFPSGKTYMRGDLILD